MERITTILLPTRPQPDTIVAIFLLQKFGGAKFPSVESARVEVRPSVPESETFNTLIEKGELALDIGGGPLDHHGKKECSSELVAKYLGIEHDPSVTQLLKYAARDDKEGKGTLSRDALDRAFGLSGLIAALNKANPKDPQKVVSAALPLIEAHWHSAREHHVELPEEVKRKRASGHYEELTIENDDTRLTLACVISDKPSMPTFLRSEKGGRFDVVLQKGETAGHVCVLSRQDRGIDLSKIAALIRMREAELRGIAVSEDFGYLGSTGRIPEMPMWYIDPATNSILNGGPHNPDIEPTKIVWDELKRIVHAGLELGKHVLGGTGSAKASYYLSINIPAEIARDIIGKLSASEAVKVHGAENLHITLQYLGAKTASEAETIAKGIEKALYGAEPFTLRLSNAQLAFGSPEGYTDTNAWFLNVTEAEGSGAVEALRSKVLPAIGLPFERKALHITLAAKRSAKDSVGAGAVRFAQPFDIELPVDSVVLMESKQSGGKRVYGAYRTFKLGK